MDTFEIDNTSDGGYACPNRNRIKVLVVMSFAVVLEAFGDIYLSKGMKAIGATEFTTLFDAIFASLTNGYVWAGIGMLLGFMMLYLASLSWADLSFVLPLTAGTYVMVTLLSFFLLHEQVSAMRWIGTVLVASGIALVTRT